MSKSYTADALSKEFHNFLADLESLLKETANLSGEELSQAREKIRRRVESAKESAVHLGSEFAESAGKVAATANHQVHEEPWKAIGAGAAVGLLLGLLFARR